MTHFSKIESPSALWVQPKGSERHFELRAEEAILGELVFRSSMGTLAEAACLKGSWTFKRVGFLNPRITVREPGSDAELAVYQPKLWGDGVLTLRDGNAFAWKPTNFWSTAWAFLNSDGKHLVEFSSGLPNEKLRDVFKIQATANIEPFAAENEALPILLMLGMYLLIMRQADSAATVAATTAAIG